MRHRLLHCQERTPLYFRTRFGRTTSHELENRLRDSKMKQSLITTYRKSMTPQQGSLTDPNIIQKAVAGNLTPKETVDIIRHST